MLKISSKFREKIAFELNRLYPNQKEIALNLIDFGVPEKAATLIAALEVYQFKGKNSDGQKVFMLEPREQDVGKINRISRSIGFSLPKNLVIGEQNPEYQREQMTTDERRQLDEQIKGDMAYDRLQERKFES